MWSLGSLRGPKLHLPNRRCHHPEDVALTEEGYPWPAPGGPPAGGSPGGPPGPGGVHFGGYLITLPVGTKLGLFFPPRTGPPGGVIWVPPGSPPETPQNPPKCRFSPFSRISRISGFPLRKIAPKMAENPQNRQNTGFRLIFAKIAKNGLFCPLRTTSWGTPLGGPPGGTPAPPPRPGPGGPGGAPRGPPGGPPGDPEIPPRGAPWETPYRLGECLHLWEG